MMFGDGVMTMAVEMGGQNRNPMPAIMLAEATEAFPDGIDGRARLEIGLQADEALYAINAQGQGEFVSASELGFRMGIPPGTPGMASPQAGQKSTPARRCAPGLGRWRTSNPS